jgi:D-xylose transport system substrate-binding protein
MTTLSLLRSFRSFTQSHLMENVTIMSMKLRALTASLSALALAVAGFSSGGVSMAAPTHQATTGTVFFIGPETYTGRWVRDDAYVHAQVKAKCPKCNYVYQNGNDEYSTQLTDAELDLSASGKKVIILGAVDSQLDAGIVNLAASQHVPVIAYDRMIEDSKLAAYVSFNASQIGALQAQYLLYALAQKKVTSGNIVQIWGSVDDNNALLFRAGFAAAFDKHFKCPAVSPDSCGTAKPQFTDAYHTYTPGWTSEIAATETQAALSKLNNKIVALYSMNDGMADSIAPTLENVGLSHIPMTGQDGQPTALARILTGTQGMTVYKRLNEEAIPAVKAAVWLLQGHKGTPPGFGKKPQCKQTVGSKKYIPCTIGSVNSVTLKPIKSLGSKDVSFPVTDGFTTWAAVCADVYPAPPSSTKPYCGLKH